MSTSPLPMPNYIEHTNTTSIKDNYAMLSQHHFDQNITHREPINNYYQDCDLTLCDPYLSYYISPNPHHHYVKNMSNYSTRGLVTELLQDEKIVPKLKDLKIKNMLYSSYMYGNPSLDVFDPEEVEKCQLLSLTSSTTPPSILSDEDDRHASNLHNV